MARHDDNNLTTYAGAAAVVATVMLHKRFTAKCGQCGNKISGKQHKFWIAGEVSSAAAELADIDPHERYCSDCYEDLKKEFDMYRRRANSFGKIRTYSINYRGKTHTDDTNGISYTTDSYDSRKEVEDTIRKVAAVYGCDAVTQLEFERDESGSWSASGTICDFE